jgi:hypothetical protein
MLRRDGARAFVDGVTSPLRRNGGARGFSKICRDITERYLTEQHLAAQLALTTVLSREEPVATTAREVMRIICENLRWDIGALWKVEGMAIRCIDYWHAAHVDGATTDDLCRDQGFARGEGLTGRVWESGTALWIPRLQEEDGLPRLPLASRAA